MKHRVPFYYYFTMPNIKTTKNLALCEKRH